MPTTFASLRVLSFLPPVRTARTFAKRGGRGFDEGQAVTADGKTLYFVSDRPGGVGGRDIWVTTLKDDKWTLPVNLGPTVNSVADDGGLTISADGKRLIFASNRPGGFGGEDLYMTTLVDGRWTPPVNLGPGINTRYNEAMAYMTKDDRELYFHSDRPGGGPGDRSIWMSKFQEGRWQPALSLGPEINSRTASNAYLSNDGLSLLFSSGVARVDERIMVASRARVTDRKWTKPVYLGPRINVAGSFFSSCPEVTADGKALFFISNRPGGGRRRRHLDGADQVTTGSALGRRLEVGAGGDASEEGHLRSQMGGAAPKASFE